MGIQSAIARRSPVRQAQAPLRHFQPVLFGFASLLILGVLSYHLYSYNGRERVLYGYVSPLPVADSAVLYCKWNPLQIKILSSGAISKVDGTILNPVQQREFLRSYIMTNDAARVKSILRIRMDSQSRAKAATSLIQIAQSEGFQHITFAVKIDQRRG